MLYACYYQIITHHKLKKRLMDYTKTIKKHFMQFYKPVMK